jgi:hypothetical protein
MLFKKEGGIEREGRKEGKKGGRKERKDENSRRTSLLMCHSVDSFKSKRNNLAVETLNKDDETNQEWEKGS